MNQLLIILLVEYVKILLLIAKFAQIFLIRLEGLDKRLIVPNVNKIFF